MTNACKHFLIPRKTLYIWLFLLSCLFPAFSPPFKAFGLALTVGRIISNYFFVKLNIMEFPSYIFNGDLRI